MRHTAMLQAHDQYATSPSSPHTQAAKDVVLAPKPVISDDTSGLEPHVLNQLLAQIGSLASVYHKPADTFISRQRLAVTRADELQVRLQQLGLAWEPIALSFVTIASSQLHRCALVMACCVYTQTEDARFALLSSLAKLTLLTFIFNRQCDPAPRGWSTSLWTTTSAQAQWTMAQR